MRLLIRTGSTVLTTAKTAFNMEIFNAIVD